MGHFKALQGLMARIQEVNQYCIHMVQGQAWSTKAKDYSTRNLKKNKTM